MGILIVDDSPDELLLMKEYLEEGHLCYGAGSGEAALEVLGRAAVDIALIDVMMPGMSGLNLFQRARELHPDLAVIFVTSIDDLDLAVEQLRQGAYDYIVKPVGRTRLHQAVEDTLERRRIFLEDVRDRRHLEQRAATQTWEMDARVRELQSLNRIFQAELAQRFTSREADYLKAQTSTETHIRKGIMSLREAEKKRIHDYLRGHVQSSLLALEHKLRHCHEVLPVEPGRASALLAEIRADLRTIHERDVRQVSHQLYPSVVTMGLVPALRSLASDFRPTLAVDLSVDPDIEAREPR